MKENRLRSLLQQGKCSVSSRLWTTWPVFVETMGASGNFDYVEFVAEYAAFTQPDLENIARAAELHGMGTMIKLDYQNRGYVAQKAIASGFQAVLFSDHHDARQVQESIQLTSCECPQDGGQMGFSNRRFIGTQSQVQPMERARQVRQVVRCFMIEKKEALENIEEICAVPGVDMVQFGGMDYSMSCGFDRDSHKEEVLAAERKMIEAALRHGVRPRCEISTPDEARYYADLGVKDFSLSDDMGALRRFWQQDGGKLRTFADGL